jgi:hypothetical protein
MLLEYNKRSISPVSRLGQITHTTGLRHHGVYGKTGLFSLSPVSGKRLARSHLGLERTQVIRQRTIFVVRLAYGALNKQLQCGTFVNLDSNA